MATEKNSSPLRLKRRNLVLLASLLALAAVMKLSYLGSYEEEEPLARAPYGDSVVYLDEARRLFEDGEQDAFYKPPVYTLLVRWFGEDVIDLQLYLGLATLALIYLMARSRAGDAAGTIAFLLFMLYAPATFYESKLLDITVSLFLLVAACASLDRLLRSESRGLAAFTGIVLGLASLCRTANLLLVPVAFFYLLFKGKKAAQGWFLLGGAVVTVLPATVHNLAAVGEFIPVNYSEGHTFLVGNNPNSRGIYNLPPGYPDGVLNERLVEREMAGRRLGREPTPKEQRDFSYREGIRYLSGDAVRIPLLVLAKLRFSLSSYEVSDNYSLPREQERFGLLKLFPLPFTILLVLGVFGLALGSKRSGLPVLMPVAVTFLLLLAFYVTCRYRLPLVPFLCIGGGVGIVSMVRPTLHPDHRRFALGVVLVIAIVLYLAFTDLPYEREELALSEAQFDVVLDMHAARTALENGDRESAARVIGQSMEYHRENEDLRRYLIRFAERNSLER